VRQQLLAVSRDLARHLQDHPVLSEQVKRLMTIKGLGLVTAATLVTELPPITEKTDPRSVCAWAGLVPRRRQTGRTESRSFISRKGNAHVRQALYMPALVAKRFNQTRHSFAERLATRGKSNPAILGAIAHKLLRIAVGLLRSKTNFDPHWSFSKT
jgi:transposase